VESFFFTLKRKLDDNYKERISPDHLHRDLAFGIEGYDSREGRHPTIDYLVLIDDEQTLIAARTLHSATT